MDLKSHVYSQWIRDIRAWLETQPGATEFDGSPLDGILRVMQHKDERLAAAEARVLQLERERREAVAMARLCCQDADFVSDWPENLHLADVIEKRIYNLCRDRKRSLAAAEAALDIANTQLTVMCEGVNRRCGADNHQLPLVSLDRMLASHARDRVNLVAWVLGNMGEFGCFTGDCPHDLNSECIESIVQQYGEDEAAKEVG